jgi:valyl-tRNA synthetase
VFRKKLSNERFVNSAPKNVVEMERKKESDALKTITLLEEKLNTLV